MKIACMFVQNGLGVIKNGPEQTSLPIPVVNNVLLLVYVERGLVMAMVMGCVLHT